MNKGQMEIMGLVMIVIIMGVIISFALVFMAGNPPEEEQVHERFGESTLGDRFVNTLSKTTVEECGTEYSTLVKDCASDRSITCTTDAGEEKDSCYWINRTADSILEGTLQEWGVSHRFRVGREGEPAKYVNLTHLNCTDLKEKEAPGRAAISLYPQPGTAYVMLEVCKT